MPKKSNATLFEVVGIDEFDEVFEGDDFVQEAVKPKKDFFDAASLSDVPGRSYAANGSQVYVLHVIFDTPENFVKGVRALSAGQRKSLLKTSKEATFNGVSLRSDGSETWLELWERCLLNAPPAPKKRKKKIAKGEDSDDEAKAPAG